MRIPWRIVFFLLAIAGAMMAFFGIRSNLRTDKFLAAVRSKDVAARASQDPEYFAHTAQIPPPATATERHRQISRAKPTRRNPSTAPHRPDPVSSPAGSSPEAAALALRRGRAEARLLPWKTWTPHGAHTCALAT